MMETRVLFMGTPEFAVPSLRRLVEAGYPVVGVVTQPDRPRGRGRSLAAPPVKQAAEELGLKVLQPERVRDHVAELTALSPDVVVTAAYGQLLSRDVLAVPRAGCLNVHASLLPKYRGGAPIHRAIMDGETVSGVTIMRMVRRLDAGPMYARVEVPILETDTYGSLHDKLAEAGASLLIDSLPHILSGAVKPVKQDESLVTYASLLSRADEWLDWRESAVSLKRRVRALAPWPGACTALSGELVKVWEASALPVTGTRAPGSVLSVDSQGITVSAGSGQLLIREVQPSGKRRMRAAEYARGRRLTEDAAFDLPPSGGA